MGSILKGNSPRELSAPAGGARKIRNDLAEVVDHCIENNLTMIENANKHTNKSGNIDTVMETEDRLETKCDKLDKLSNEKTNTLGKERTINKNNENNRKQSNEEPQKILEILIDEEIDLDRQKNSKNNSNHNEGIKRSENNN